jgi:ABC-type cobalt transport system, permease component
MGTALVLSNSTIKLSFGWNAFFFWGTWVICIAGIGLVLWSALRSKNWERWTTQDILIVAALGVLLEVYDNIIGDQFVKPLLDVIPGAHLLQVHDLPYMFLLMVGVALVRKPGCVTAMVFVNFLLAQLLFGSGHGALDWTDGLTQGIFCDMYLVARRGRVYGPNATTWSMVIDGLMIGMLRGGPNAFLTDWTFDPYLNSIYYTWYQMWLDVWPNAIANGVEAAVSATLALRVARSVIPSISAGRRGGAGAASTADPFAEPAEQAAGAAPASTGAAVSPAGPEVRPAEGELA